MVQAVFRLQYVCLSVSCRIFVGFISLWIFSFSDCLKSHFHRFFLTKSLQMYTEPQTSLLSIERELQLIDEEFSNAAYGQQGTALARADDEALFQELSAAMDLQQKRSEHMITTLEESFRDEEQALDFPVHTRQAVGEEAEENLQKFMREMHARDNALRSFQGTLHQSMKHMENIHEILMRGHQNGA